MTRRFPRLYAAASLKLARPMNRRPPEASFSAALCRGLIEAILLRSIINTFDTGFPRLYAAASLKHLQSPLDQPPLDPFSAALCRGLIEAYQTGLAGALTVRFSAALCRGLIEAHSPLRRLTRSTSFSAALCRGLIEAPRAFKSGTPGKARFPRLYAAASLKHH